MGQALKQQQGLGLKLLKLTVCKAYNSIRGVHGNKHIQQIVYTVYIIYISIYLVETS